MQHTLQNETNDWLAPPYIFGHDAIEVRLIADVLAMFI
jgi:hypothetical protein